MTPYAWPLLGLCPYVNVNPSVLGAYSLFGLAACLRCGPGWMLAPSDR